MDFFTFQLPLFNSKAPFFLGMDVGPLSCQQPVLLDYFCFSGLLIPLWLAFVSAKQNMFKWEKEKACMVFHKITWHRLP